jgi:hypothetical protein
MLAQTHAALRFACTLLCALALASYTSADDHADHVDHADDEEHAFEWAGVFRVADSSHTWSMQSVGGEYADATMRLVLIPTDAPTAVMMESGEEGAGSLIAGETCAVIEDGASMTPAAEGSCFELHVGAGDDSTFTIDTSGISGVAVYAQHLPTEFERDRHYLHDSSGAEVEPIAQESAGGDRHDQHDEHGDLDGFTSNPPLLVISRSFLTNCLWLQATAAGRALGSSRESSSSR